MGIDLADVVVRNAVPMSHFSGQRVAIDGWNVLYQFLASIRGPDGTPLMDTEGRITSHLAGLLNRTGSLVEAGIKPIFVFDGTPHQLKGETLAARSARKVEAQAQFEQAIESGDLETARTKAQQTSRLTVPMVEQAQGLLRALGIPVVQAPSEGEAQAAWMCQNELADATVSQDFDALLFGTPILARHLATGGRRKMPGKQVWAEVTPEEIPLQASLAAMGLTREQLVDAALLVGTDFHPGIKGIGAKKAIPVIKAEGSLEALLARLEKETPKSALERSIVEQRDALTDREEVRRIFLQPAHNDCGPQTLTDPDPAKVREIMVERHGFNPERVATAIEKYVAARKKKTQQRLF